MLVSNHLHRIAMLLAGVSTAVVQLALLDRESGAGLSLLGVSVALAWWLRRYALRGASWTPRAVAGMATLAALPLAWDAATRSLLGYGSAYEVQVACVLRNLMIALAVMPRLPRATNLAVLASFFLIVFGYMWETGPWSVTLLVVYGLLGTWWLLASYWERLGGRFADSTESRFPVRPAVATLAALALVSVVLMPLATGSSTTTALAGFFPSSGGTELTDPFAHGGVGDGDQMVAAKEQASSFGPVDSELFLESKMPSLYDTFNEFSEATPDKKKRLRRAIPLSPSSMQVNHEKRGMTQRATREFSTVRQRTPRRRDTEDRLSAALLLVRGRAPLHLALETYDLWDGRSLSASAAAAPVATRLQKTDASGYRWLELGVVRPASLFTATAASQVRIVNLKTNRVPAPAGVDAVTVKDLHSESMFRFTSDGCLAMDMVSVPQLTIFEFRSSLRERGVDPLLVQTTPAADPGRVSRLAAEWVGRVPAGWPQVEAVVDRLRNGYRHDREAMVPPEAEDAVEHFLFESKRGPDYLFAASAAVMLQSLGYDTRVRSGFYAGAKQTSKLTPLVAEDAHFWVEVRCQNGLSFAETEAGEVLPGTWITVEPTPGYAVQYAPETWIAWLARVSAEGVRAVVARPVASLTVTVATLCVFFFRARLLDGLLIAWWLIRSPTTETGKLARLTLRLLEWRAWVHRKSRPAGVPLGRWEAIDSQGDFVALVGWALYGPNSAAPLTSPSARAVCGRAIRTRLND